MTANKLFDKNRVTPEPDDGFYEVVKKEEFGALYGSMPRQVKLNYGCLNCEWKDAGVCIMGLKRGSTDKYGKGICEKRIKYLAGFVVGLQSYVPGKCITFSQWQSAMIQMTSSRQHLKDEYKFKQMQFDLEEYELKCQAFMREELTDEDRLVDVFDKDIKVSELSDTNKTYRKMLNKLNRMKTELHYKRGEWLSLIDKMAKQSSNQLDRETPKKLEIDVNKTMRLSDIHRIMRGKKKEEIVEGEVIENERE